MRRPLVAANWKMNGSREEARSLLDGILPGLAALRRAEVVICPPYVLIPPVAGQLRGSAAAWGAQNLNEHRAGAYTGEVSGAMLRDYECRYVIVGHSERRTLYGETDARVAKKAAAALDCGLVPIICVGETLEEREAGRTEAVVGRQLDAVLEALGTAGPGRAVIAYEPVWAIGTGRNASPDQAQAVHAFLCARVAQRDPGVAEGLRILYGGSVKGGNAQALFAQPDIDGGLIGGASLNADEFLQICRAAD